MARIFSAVLVQVQGRVLVFQVPIQVWMSEARASQILICALLWEA